MKIVRWLKSKVKTRRGKRKEQIDTLKNKVDELVDLADMDSGEIFDDWTNPQIKIGGKA